MTDRRHAAATLVLLLVVMPVSVAAEEGSSEDVDRELSERQRELNNQGVEAIEAENYETAIDLYEASLQLGELNILYANLGRAHQLAGYCREADELFDRALEAPGAEVPPPEVVEETIEDYRAELHEDCPGFVEISCQPADLEVAVDDERLEQGCSDEPIEFEPGDYRVVAEHEDRRSEREVGVEALETTSLEFDLVEQPEPDPPAAPEEAGRLSGLGWTGVAGVAAGAGAVGGALWVDGQVADHRRQLEENSEQITPETMREEVDRIDSWQTRGRVLLFGGLGLVVAGGSLVAVDALSRSSADGDRRVEIAPTVDRPGLAVFSRW